MSSMPKRRVKKRAKAGVKPKSRVPRLIRSIEPKYFDTLSVANSIGAGGTFFVLNLIPQGDSQGTRVGDFIQPLRMLFNYSLYVANTDITTTIRLLFLRWKPSNALVSPVIADILQAPASSNVLSHFNFQLQENYDVLWEKQYQASGTAGAPTCCSNFGGTGVNIPLKKNPDLEYSLGVLTSTNALYLLALSDSSLAPFPLLNFAVRLYYEDTIREHHKGIVK